MTTVRKCVTIALLVAATGCGEPSVQVPTEKVVAQSVRGRVEYVGKPAAGVRVTFVPTAGAIPNGPPRHPAGVTGADGAFTLTSYKDGDGAPAGDYQVVLYWPVEAGGEREAGEDRLYGWYDVKHTPLSARVKEGNNDIPAFQLAEVKGEPPPVAGVSGRN